MPERDYDTMSKAIPFVRERFSSFRAYGNAGVDDLLGDQLSQAKIPPGGYFGFDGFLESRWTV